MIKVLIAEDQQLFRDLLEHMLQNNEEFQVVATTRNGCEAIDAARLHQPDVILMDLYMPECDGLEAIRTLRREGNQSKILVLSASQGEGEIEEAIRLGSEGYIPKNISKEELFLAIRSVYSGMEVIHKTGRDILQHATKKTVTRRGDKIIVMVNEMEVVLSQRDVEIIRMIIDGKTTEEIAGELFLAEGRVRNIITDLISKLMLKDKTQLAVFAIKNKLI